MTMNMAMVSLTEKEIEKIEQLLRKSIKSQQSQLDKYRSNGNPVDGETYISLKNSLQEKVHLQRKLRDCRPRRNSE